jgi:hypothetical protein
MNARVNRFATASLIVLSAALLASCSKSNPGPQPPPPPPEWSHEIADRTAQAIANGPMEIALGLVSAPMAPAGSARLRAARPSRVGRVSTDSTDFAYEIHAYDVMGHEVAWDTTPMDSIARMTMDWRYAFDYADQGQFLKWNTEGHFEFVGFAGAQPRLVVTANAQELWDWDLAYDNVTSKGHFDARSAIDHVAWEKSGTPIYPVAGTITMLWVGSWSASSPDGNQSESINTSSKVTLNGSRYADLVVDGKYHFQLDLETGGVAGPTV